MPRQPKPKDDTLLEMAIVGYQIELERISARIAEINEQLGKRGPGRPKSNSAMAVATATDQATPKKRSTMSAAGRARIAAAQRARWAAQKRQQGQPAKPVAPAQPAKPKKRKMSAAGLKAIREATKKRWAAYNKAKEAVA
jgi:hypothetical protein